MQLSHQAFHAFKWSALGEAAARTISPLVFLVLARLLVPEDFGVVAAATVVISFCQVFSDAGLAKALIQRQGRTDDSANVVFWFNLGLGVLIVSILFAIAPQIADFFHDPRIASVTRVLSVQILLAAFSSTHTALLQKKLDFKQLFWVRLLTTGLPALASIPLALAGFGYWSLVAGSVAGQATQSIMLWRLSPWRPTWRIDRALAIELVQFGKWAMLSGVLGWSYGWMDAVVVGHYLGSHDMGLYRTGNTLVTMVFGLVFAPMLPVLYSLFSRAQTDLPKLQSALVTITHAIALSALPVGFFLFVSAGKVGELFFGPKWTGIGDVIGMLALTHAFSWLVGANGEVYRAIGKPNIETWVPIFLLPVYLVGYVVSVHMGLTAFLDVRLILCIIAVVTHACIANVVLQLPFTRWVFAGIMSTSAIAALVTDSIGVNFSSLIIDFLVMAMVFFTIVAIGIFLFERTFVRQLFDIFRKKTSK